ncbi:MAG: response regulator [Ardenticatenales bacterium]|nr:response regulator [Ardenticatenales bacterium]
MYPSRQAPPLILVADDEPDMRLLLRRMLELHDFEVLEAKDGIECTQMALVARPDVIVLDVMMPDISGFEVARKLRGDGSLAWTPILMVTGLTATADKIRGLEAGADDFISKPFNGSELITRIRSLLRLKQIHDESERRNEDLERMQIELEQQSKTLRRVLLRYMSPAIVDTMLSDPTQNLKLGGATLRVTVLLADIRGFMTFSDQRSAQEVLYVLNTLWTSLVPIIFDHKGTFDKYIGDAILSFYGAPTSLGDDAYRAVCTALTMQKKFEELRGSMPILSELGLGIGLVTGNAVVGNAGSEQVMDYTVIGHPPNTAQRLQEIAGKGQTIICDETYTAVKDQVIVRALPPLDIRGRKEPLQAYELLGLA